ncbi:deoxyuridine 5'-triphosphate nucleotidohydrolase [bacterium]|nr:deoxyuridine 5'-triphosphate nucleotidohydrolase [bacterium]MBU1753521.1 deoxyuridine 5'-triphosphate nucleotidohydrolase [bacterium]
MGTFLAGKELVNLIQTKGLIECLIDAEVQVQINGVELSLCSVEAFVDHGTIGFHNQERILAKTCALEPDSDGWFLLKQGQYKIIFNEIVNIPNDMMAIARPRSSLLRCGVSVETAVWDSGYSGRSEALLLVHNSHGFRVKKDARLIQLLFFRLQEMVAQGYAGIYQGENIAS